MAVRKLGANEQITLDPQPRQEVARKIEPTESIVLDQDLERTQLTQRYQEPVYFPKEEEKNDLVSLYDRGATGLMASINELGGRIYSGAADLADRAETNVRMGYYNLVGYPDPPENAEATISAPQGNIVSRGLRGLSEEEFRQANIRRGYIEGQNAQTTVDFEDVKQNPLSLDTLTFMAEQSALSAPYMATAAVPYIGAPIVSGAISEDIMQDRNVNQGRDVRDPVSSFDAQTAVLAAGASAGLERIGVLQSLGRGITGGGARAVTRLTQIPGNATKSGLGEFATEALQENIEMAGSTVGTDKDVTLQDVIDTGVSAGLVGFGMGATVRTGSDAVNYAQNGFSQQNLGSDQSVTPKVTEPQSEPAQPAKDDLAQSLQEESTKSSAPQEQPAKVPQKTLETTPAAPSDVAVGDVIEQVNPYGEVISGTVQDVIETETGRVFTIADDQGVITPVLEEEGEIQKVVRPTRDDLSEAMTQPDKPIETKRTPVAPIAPVVPVPENVSNSTPLQTPEPAPEPTIEQLQTSLETVRQQARQSGWNRTLIKRRDDLQAQIEKFSPELAKANDIKNAETEVNHEPTEAQKEAGNYKKGHVKLQGFDVTIENAKGSIRSGTDTDGETWQVEMPAAYGYIKRTTGADGDHLDVYIGENPESQRVFVMDQIDANTGAFDEHKSFIGFNSIQEAADVYSGAFSDGKATNRNGGMTIFTLDEFKDWVKNGDTKKPLQYKPVKEEKKKVSQEIPREKPTVKESLTVQGAVGMQLEEGQVVLTSTGRKTTPFPRFLTKTTGKISPALIKKVDNWLMQNALDEARARGDEFNARQFEANLKKPSPADKDSAELYLFDPSFSDVGNVNPGIAEIPQANRQNKENVNQPEESKPAQVDKKPEKPNSKTVVPIQSGDDTNVAIKPQKVSAQKPQEKKAASRGDTVKQKTVTPNEISDFGEKIAGAKKDLWKEYISRISEDLPEDLTKITLSKHFPEPNYEKLIEDGVKPEVLGAIKAMRDTIPNKPRAGWKLKGWAAQVAKLREFSQDIINGDVEYDLLIERMREQGRSLKDLANKIELYKDLGYPLFTRAGDWTIYQSDSMYRNNEPVGKTQYVVMHKNRYGDMFDTREEALEDLKNKLGTEPEKKKKQVKLDIYQVRKTKEILIGKKLSTRKYIDLKGGFKTWQEARLYLADNRSELEELLAKKKEIPSERRVKNEPRQGKDYRKGNNITPEQFQNEFGFRGVQFGNYVEQDLREQNLNDAYDAMLDMADILGIPAKAVSLDGTLGLAFGARGSGGVNPAKAHYEPGQVVINLTKKSGAGSLGHEWWHALDNNFGKRRDGPEFLSQRPKPDVRVSEQPIRGEVFEAFDGVMKAIKDSGLMDRSRRTDKMRTKPYFGTAEEMTARAFEAYLIHKASKKGESNDFLANIVGKEAWDILRDDKEKSDYPYPTQEEMEKYIAPAFDNLFKTLKTQETPSGVALFAKEDASFVLERDAKQQEKIERAINKRLKQRGFQKANVVLFNDHETTGIPYIDNSVEGAYWRGIIYISMKHKDPLAALDHEILHALRDGGAFTEGEWKFLESKASEWRKKYDIDSRYSDLPMTEMRLNEEAIASALQDYSAKGPLRRIINRLKRFFEAIRYVLFGSEFNFDTAEQVFDSVMSGRVGARMYSHQNTAQELPAFSYRDVAAGLRSILVDAVDNIKQERGTGKQMLAMLRKTAGVKEEEIVWTGLDEFLSGAEQVQKSEIKTYLNENKVEIEEISYGAGNVSPPYSIKKNDKGGYSIYKNDIEAYGFETKAEAEEFAQRPPFSATKFSEYTLPGGKNYREVLLTLPDPVVNQLSQAETDKQDFLTQMADKYNVVGLDLKEKLTESEDKKLTRLTKDIRNLQNKKKPSFNSSHFSHPNILAHTRLNDRTTADGKRTLFIEEIQSDWHQQGRKKGYQSKPVQYKLPKNKDNIVEEARQWSYTNNGRTFTVGKGVQEKREFAFEYLQNYVGRVNKENSDAAKSGVPDAPFKKNWHEMAFRRIVQMAAQNGYDSVSWTPGEIQNDRYDLSKVIDSITYFKADDGRYYASARDMSGNQITPTNIYTPNELEDTFGKDISEKIIKQSTEKGQELSGDGLKIGGSGMKGFYDKILKSYAEKFGKKYGAKVSAMPIVQGVWNPLTKKFYVDGFEVSPESTDITDVWTVPITDKMRSAADEGLPLFSLSKNKNEAVNEARSELLRVRGRDKEFRPAIGKVSSYVLHPHQIASLFKSFTPVYMKAVDMMKFRDMTVHSMSSKIDVYNKLNAESTKKVNAVLEIGRLSGQNYKEQNGKITVKNTEYDNTIHSKVGETITLSGSEVDAYLGVRSAMDLALEKYKDTILTEYKYKERGINNATDLIKSMKSEIDPFEKRQMKDVLKMLRDIEQAKKTGYVPLKRWGQVGVTVRAKGEDGELIHFERVELPKYKKMKGKLIDQKRVQEALKKLDAKYAADKYDIDIFEVKDYSILQSKLDLTELDLLAANSDMSQKDYDNLRDMLKDAMARTGFKAHFFHSNDVPGYDGDFERAINDYIVSISGHLARRMFKPKMDEQIEKIIESQEPTLVKYAKEYVDYIMEPTEEFAAVRQMGFMWYLAGNIASGVTNATQPLMVTAPWLKGMFKHKDIARQMSRAYKETAQMVGKGAGKDIFDFNKAPDDVKSALQEAAGEGDFLPLETYESMGIARSNSAHLRGLGRKARQVQDAIGLTFSIPERTNRIVTFMTAYRFAIDPANRKAIMSFVARDQLGRKYLKDKEGKDFAKAFAEYAVFSTQFRMGKLNRPMLGRKFGTLVFQFMSFSLQSIELMYRLKKVHGGSAATSFGVMLLAVVAMSGIKGFPFAEDLEDLMEWAHKQVTRTDIDLEFEMRKKLSSMFGPVAADAILKGVPRAALNVDMSARLGYGNLIPDDSSDLLGIWWDMLVVSPLNAGVELARGDEKAALAEISPTFISNIIKAYSWSEEGIRSGLTGDAVISKENVKNSDVYLKLLGFTSANVSRERERIYTVKRANRAVNDLRADYYDILARLIISAERAEMDGQPESVVQSYWDEYDGVLDQIARYNATQPDYRQIIMHKPSLKQRIQEERDGADANKMRKQARSYQIEIDRAFGKTE